MSNTVNEKLNRRRALRMIGAAGAAAVAAAACSSEETPTSPSVTTGTAGISNSDCAVTPTETVGPYPSLTDLIRSDVREGKPGTDLVMTIKVVNVNGACAPVSGVNVEIWSCDHAGNYSSYGSQTAQTYLRGIQTTNVNGEATFTTIYPGWYQGRATHIHVEVTRNNQSIKVTQVAFPETVNNIVHTSGVYASRGVNPTTNARDGIFADSLASEITTPTGSPSGGYTASFQVGISI
jgi:protocatechuate 3,4-dioxygenase beta subunit